MISVMKGFEIERKLASSSVIGAADRSFLVMDNPLEGATISDAGYSGVSSEARVSYRVDLAGKMPDLGTRVSAQGEERGSVSLDEAVMEIDGGGKDIAYVDEENSVSFYELGGGMHGFRVGDMVWGKVKSHPWWPGHIFNEAFASPAVRRMRREGLVLVAFFGDSSYGWFDPAELVPFEPHFSEKSRQTTSRSFVKAVEEALDEASRRGALGVACRCRNMSNFRLTTAAGYFFVDIVGYEPGGIYSSRQIKKARDSLVPAELLSFVRQSALDLRNHHDSIEWIQTMAKLMAYRKAVFEEYDETYAQAFGVEPSRPSSSNMVAFDQTDRFAHRGAPLSGPLVIAEAVGEQRSAARQASNKHSNSGRKNKYVLKRRDDLLAPAGNSSLPDLPFASSDSTDPPATSAIDVDYALRTRAKLAATTEASVASSHKSEAVEDKNSAAQSAAMVAAAIPLERSELYVDDEYKMPVFDDGVAAVKKETASKRPREEEGGEGKKRRKKKKKDGLGADENAADQRRLGAGRSIGQVDLSAQEDGVNMELPRGLDLASLQLPQLISDLSFIALDPFYAIERDAPAIVRHVFLRFRSMVYQKSLILPSSAEAAAPSHKESFFSSKPPKPASKLGDKTKAVRKRDPSDRQEGMWVKKMEKMNQLKQLASKKKKTAIVQKNSESKDQKEITATEAAPKKQEPKLPSPTFLIMKFPPKSTLPSVANLKARFARFGPLDLLGTRVSWKTYSCRVLFKHKSDAQSAVDFVQNNDLFGHFKVIYFLRDQEISSPDQPLDPLIKPSDSSLSDRHGSTSIQPTQFSQAQQGQTQLKSILKKPGNEESNPNYPLASIAIARESPRVKFMLNGDDDRGTDPPPPTPSKPISSSNNGGSQAPSLPPIDQINWQTPSRGLEMHPNHIPPPPSPSPLQPQMLPPRPPPPQPRAAAHFHPTRGLRPPPSEPMEKMTVDISGPMLSLLLKCNDIVCNVKSSLGYNPYHSL